MRTKYIILTVLSSLVFASAIISIFDETNGLKTKKTCISISAQAKILSHVYHICRKRYAYFATEGIFFRRELFHAWLCLRRRWVRSLRRQHPKREQRQLVTHQNVWWRLTLYRGIRAANSFLTEIAISGLLMLWTRRTISELMKQLKYFLTRPECCAHTTFELARRYGDIAMPLEVLTEEEANNW